MSKAEQVYAYIEKDVLALVLGLKTFHKYLFGDSFVIYSIHQQLAVLLTYDKPVPVRSAARTQRWTLLLVAYGYWWVYCKGSDIGNNDAHSKCFTECATADVGMVDPQMAPNPTGVCLHRKEVCSGARGHTLVAHTLGASVRDEFHNSRQDH